MADATRTINTKFDGDARGLAAAARQGEKVVGDFGDKAGKSFITRFRQWVTGAGRVETTGSIAGRLFGSGLLRGLSIPGFGAKLLGVLLGAVVAVAPVVGGALAAGIIAGLGAGLTGLGIFFAAQFKVVEEAWSQTIDHMEIELSHISGAFAPVLVDIAEMVRNTFDTFAPSLQAAFDRMAPAVEAFTGNLLAAFTELEPAVQPVADAFSRLLDSLGPELPGIVAAIAGHLQAIAGTVSQNPEAFAFFFEAALRAVSGLLAVISFLAIKWASVWEGFQSTKNQVATLWHGIAEAFWSGVRVALEALDTLRSAITTFITDLLRGAADAIAQLPFGGPLADKLNEAADNFETFSNTVGSALDRAKLKAEEWRSAHEQAPKELKLKGDIRDLAQKVNSAVALLRVAPKDKTAQIKGDIRNLTQAAINADRRLQSIRDKTANIKGNARGLSSAVATATQQLAGLRDRTVYIDVITRFSVRGQRINPRQVAGGFGGDDGRWFQNADGGTNRTDPPEVTVAPPTVNVFIDGEQMLSGVRTLIEDNNQRQAWRANVGRR